MASNHIERFRGASRNLQLQPLLSDEDRAKFWVEYGGECLDQLEQKVLDCTESTNQFVFAGHTGCGKSTLLKKFSQKLDEEYFTVFFSIADLIQANEINHINILFAIALQMMEKATEQNIAIAEEKKQAFFNWFKERTETITTGNSGDIGFGLDLFGIIKGNLKTSHSTKEEIKTKFTKNFRDLTETLNAIATEIKLATKREIVVIIDDLDKADLNKVDEIFKENLKALLQPRFIVIYTIPIATIRDGVLKKYIEDETGNRIFVMPVLKLYPKGESRKPDGKPHDRTLKILQALLTRRIDADLFEAGIEEKIEDVKIDQAILTETLNNLRNDMTITLSKSDREILLETYSNYRPDDPKQQEFLDLLHNLVAIEYRNSESWYDVHPLIVEQLRIEELILVESAQ